MNAVSTTARLMVARRSSARTLPIPLRFGRMHLPALARSLRFTRGAEIGVWKGAFTEAFCKASPDLHMLAVDPWQSYLAWLDTKNAMPLEQAQRSMDQAYAEALQRLSSLNCTIVRQFSAEAAAEVPDRSLHFVYIDANHVEAAVYEDLTLWAPKVRAGGFVAGHDYRLFENKPTIHVIEAVQTYTREHGIDPWFILTGDRTPSFLWVVR